MGRKSIPANMKRKLWAQCGGYCQNPNCNKYLFADVEDDTVSLANIAHIIGVGKDGPRTEHEIADYVDRNGIDNLIMLCLDCHKIVDELEHRFPVEEMQAWKSNHYAQISANFAVPNINDEKLLLEEINDLLDENRLIFEEYGPFSRRAIEGSSGDAKKIWRRRCLDTILPNNERIINLIERNKRNFAYPWGLYRQVLRYKIHADSFRENCLFEEKVNDYKLFPLEFDHFVKSRLGIPVEDLETRENEEIEYRRNTISTYMQRFLANHSCIESMEKWNRAIFTVSLIDGRNLRVFVTNTYYFTDYTFGKILAIDPYVDVIICSNPYATYSESAKRKCIQNGVGLFMLKEFMGAIHTTGTRFLNYLLNEDRDRRVSHFTLTLKNNPVLKGKCEIYLFGSYLRHQIFDDVDIILVYKNGTASSDIDTMKMEIVDAFREHSYKFDFIACSQDEFSKLSLDYDNRVRVL